MRLPKAIALGLVLIVSLMGGCHTDVKPPEPPPIHPEPPRLPKPEEPPLRPPVPVPGSLENAEQQAVRAGEEDQATRELLCFVYSEFYDPSTGEVRLPSADGFINDVFETLLPHSEEEEVVGTVSSTYELVQNLAAGELLAVAESLACA